MEQENSRLFKTALNYDVITDGNRNVKGGASLTKPHQAMTIREMVNKYTIKDEYAPFPEQYDTPESVGLPDIHKLDKIEINQLQRSIKEDIEKQQAALRMASEQEKIVKDREFDQMKEQIRKMQEQNPDINPE